MTDIRVEVCSFDNLYKAMMKCRKGVMWKDSVARYVNNGLINTLKLKNSLDNNTYKIDNYYHFTIHEPKQREIVSTRFKDRVFQRSLCDNYLYHEITRHFIYDNGACQINRGTNFTRNRLKVHLRKYYLKHGSEGYVLKIDLKNYFGSTPHIVVKNILRQIIDDEWALLKVFEVIDSYNEDGLEVGLGLGSQITQLLQLLVLNRIDHYIKEVLKIKYYIRYMDDLVIIHSDKEKLVHYLEDIRIKMSEIGLALNNRKTQIFKISQGINFLGFKFCLSDSGKVYTLLHHSNINKRKRKLRKYKNMVISGEMTKDKVDGNYKAWGAHAKYGNSYKLMYNMDMFYKNLWRSNDVQEIDVERTA